MSPFTDMTEAHLEQPVLFQPDSYVDRLDLPRLFGNTNPVEVELGAGDGSFLVQWAGLNPATNILGLERLLGRLRKIDRKSRRAGLTNVRVLRLEATYEWKQIATRPAIA